ncbi:MAG: amidohydrolase [Tissierellia bacterium]|nr:amidohydrolase [Tissierellia bacterium]
MKTLFINGNVHTMDEAAYADAFVVEGNKFVYVGTQSGARDYLKAQSFDEVDLKGLFVMPGFNDSHMHFLHYSKSLQNINLTGVRSIEEIKERIRENLNKKEHTDNFWLEGEGWNDDYFIGEKRFPNKFDLDSVTGDVPTLIMRACMHIGVLNSAALKLLGLNKETAKKYGEFIETLTDGEPNGVIKEGLLSIVKTNTSVVDLDTLKNLIDEAQHFALAKGITSIQTDDIAYTAERDYELLFQAFKELDEEKRLKIRLGEQCSISTPDLLKTFFEKGYNHGYGNNKYRVNCIKLFTDGSLGARTAALRAPYNDAPDTKGIEIYTQDEINELVLISHMNNCPVAIHAIGDRGMEMSLNAIENAQKKNPVHNLRHGIVHCQITDEELLNRIRELNVITFIQPIFIDCDIHTVYDRVGNELAETSYAWKTMIDKGIHASFGTDCPVERFDTMPNIYTAVTRKNITGEEKKIYLPNQKLSMDEALKAYTIEGAYASGEEHIKGSITVGKLADFILLDKDLSNLTSDEEILNTKVIETYVDGESVYKK